MLVDYFRYPNYINALIRYVKVAEVRNWGIDYKLKMYNWAKAAFESSLPESKKRESFHAVYENLRRYWQVFRNARAGYWSADETFDGLNNACKACSRQRPLTLISLQYPSQECEEVLLALDKLRNLKPVRDYPWMPVAKFTHFFNPKLFPVYDTQVIWQKVMNGAFRMDYRIWCNSQNFNPNGPGKLFYLYYMLWAGDIIRQADIAFMGYFSEWFQKQVGNQPDSYHIKNDMRNYYSIAFEYVAIGAAELELSGQRLA